MKKQIVVEIPDEADCNKCDFEYYDGNNCYCQLFRVKLSSTCCDECLEIRSKTVEGNSDDDISPSYQAGIDDHMTGGTE